MATKQVNILSPSLKTGTCLLAILVWHPGLASGQTTTTPDETTTPASESNESSKAWTPLAGNDLSQWKKTNFGGEGDVALAGGVLELHMGSPLTGITYAGKQEVPKLNYEIQLEARRVKGHDFFCGLTFPYKDKYASLIIGGWGGGVCGISCLGHYDASENESMSYQKFESGRWYKIRLRVTDDLLEAWLDGRLIVDSQIDGRDVRVRDEVKLSRPLGLASFQTQAEIRGFTLTPCTPASPDVPAK